MNVRATDPWAWWQEALDGRFGPIHPDQPEQGYFRTRYKQGQWEPVLIWFENDRWWALRSGQYVGERDPDDRKVRDLWSFCCRHPITSDAYAKALGGEGFDDEPPAPAIGHNSSSDPREALWLEFMGEKEQATEFIKAGIKTQDAADRLSIWKDRFLKIKTRAAALFKEEKQPILDEGRRIDEKWRPLAHDKGDAADMVEACRRALDGFMREQKRAEEERQRQAREVALRLEREAEEAARRAALAEDTALAAQADAGPPDGPTPEETAELRRQAEEIAAMAKAAEKDAEARKVSAGRTGATTSFRKEKVAVVTDYGKAAAALVAMGHPDFLALIDTLAKRAAKAGMPFDGMEIKEVEKLV